MKQETASLMGKSLFFASIQVALASIEMDSKFAIKTVKTQDALDHAIHSLKSYIVISIIWTLASMFTLYSIYGTLGIFVGFITNFAVVMWIIITYKNLFAEVCKNNGLKCVF